MKVNIKEVKESCQIHVEVEVDPIVGDGSIPGPQEVIYLGTPEIREILANKGVKVGRLLKRSTINNEYENACSGLWRFEMPPRPKKAATTRRVRKTTKVTASAKKSDEKPESEV
tara:strand:- start:221 stop:562 length:342 start_codon:yes stop_codon:yes gene_type:complete